MEAREMKIAEDLLSIRAVFFRPDEPFTWASGIKSPVYCDNRLTLTAPAVRNDVETGLAELIRENYPTAEVLSVIKPVYNFKASRPSGNDETDDGDD